MTKESTKKPPLEAGGVGTLRHKIFSENGVFQESLRGRCLGP